MSWSAALPVRNVCTTKLKSSATKGHMIEVQVRSAFCMLSWWFLMLVSKQLSLWFSQCWRRRLSLGLPAAETLQSQWKVSWLLTLYKLGDSTCSIYHQPFKAPWSAESDCSFRTGGPDGGERKITLAVLLVLLHNRGEILSSSMSKAVILPELDFHFSPSFIWMGPLYCLNGGADTQGSSNTNAR